MVDFVSPLPFSNVIGQVTPMIEGVRFYSAGHYCEHSWEFIGTKEMGIIRCESYACDKRTP